MVASVTTIGLRDLARGYVAPVRAPTQEREADEALRPQDIADLRWFYGSLESACGVQSTFGAQLERCDAKQAHHTAIADERRYQRQRVKEWVEAGHHPNDPGSPKWDREFLPIKETAPYAAPDPYADDSILEDLAKAHRIRSILKRCSLASVKVLFCVYGPALGDEEQRRDARKKFGDLAQIVVNLAAFARTDSDPSARALVSARLTDDGYVRIQKNRAAGMLRVAAREYAAAEVATRHTGAKRGAPETRRESPMVHHSVADDPCAQRARERAAR